MPFGARITFPCTNNEAEYEACILRLEEAVNIQIKTLDVYGDSALVINQTNGKWCYAGTTYPELTYLGQRRMKKAFGQKVRSREYRVGELVLKRFLPPNTDHWGKWTPN